MAVDDPADDEFSWFFREEYPSVVRLAYLMVGNRSAAEDIAQEAFVRLFTHWRKVSRYESPPAWVRRVAIRIAARSRRRKPTLEVNPDAGAAQVFSIDVDLEKAILQLPRAQRGAIVLHYFEDRSIAEVAALLGCATNTAKVHLHRGRKRLEKTLGEAGHVHR